MSLGQQQKSGIEYMIRNNVDIWTHPTNPTRPVSTSAADPIEKTHTRTQRPSEFDFPFQHKKELRACSASKMKQVNQKGMFINLYLLQCSSYFVFGFKLKSLYFLFLVLLMKNGLEYCFVSRFSFYWSFISFNVLRTFSIWVQVEIFVFLFLVLVVKYGF